MTPVINHPSPQQAEVHLHDYLRIIMRRRRTFLLVFSLVFFAVLFYTLTTNPIYEASATLHVKEAPSGRQNVFSELGLSRVSPIDTEIEIIKSRTNAEQVVKRLNLHWNVSKKSRGLSFNLADFDSTLPGIIYRVELTGPDSYKVLNSEGRQLGVGSNGQLLQTSEFRLLLTDLKGASGDSFRLSMAALSAAGNGLKGKLKATRIGNQTNILRVAYTDTDPGRARDVVNTLAAVYLEQSVSLKTREASKSVEFLEGQMKTVRGELDIAENNLQAYKSSTGLVKLDSEAEELVKKISETEKERTGLVLQKKQVEFALEAQRDALKNGRIYSPAAFRDDPGVAALAGKLAELEVQKRGLSAELTDTHPQVKSLQGQIDEIQKKLVAIFETSRKNLVAQEIEVNQILNRYEAAIKLLPEAERDLARLMRHTKVNADVYTFLLQKSEEARIAKASTISNIDVVDPAILPMTPIKPNKKKNILLGLLVGLMLAVGLAMFQEYLDDTIKDADGARLELGMPVLAVIPHIQSKGAPDSSSKEASLVANLEPKSVVAEAFRALRTSLHFSVIGGEKKVYLGTSTFPGEGKTTIIANLAVTLAQTGARVMIVDADLRRPNLHNIYGHSKVPGLSEILAGDKTADEAVHKTDIAGLAFISAGTTPPNPAELLGSTQMSTFIDELRQRYDYVLIDAPPVLAVSDAPLLAACCDMMILVLETERVPLKAAHHMVELLRNVQAPIVGVVVNDKSGKSRERYGYYGSSYYDYSYYGEEEKASSGKRSWWRKMFRV